MPGWLKREYLILLGVTFLWGSGHTAAKVALRELDVAQLALLRPGFAWLVLSLPSLSSSAAALALYNFAAGRNKVWR